MDFAVLGNASTTLAWLQETIASVPGVHLLGPREVAPGWEWPSGRTGVVAEGFGEDVGGAPQRIAVVLEDPVRLSASAGETGGTAGSVPPRYAELLRPLLESAGGRALVFAADELRSRERVRELFDHLELVAPSVPPTPGPAADGEALSTGRRAVLFGALREDVEQLEAIAGRTFASWRFGVTAEPAPVEIDRSVLVYIGRERGLGVPSRWLALDDWQVLPVTLGPLLDEARHLVVLDPMSYPFDAMRPVDREIPLSVRLPGGWDSATLIQLLGGPLLRHLTPFDRLCVEDDAVWLELRAHYAWPAGMRTSAAGLLEEPAPRTAMPPRRHKSIYRALRGLVGPHLARARELIPPAEHPNVLLLADDVGLWASLHDSSGVDLAGVSAMARELEHAARDYPEWSFLDAPPAADHDAETRHIALSMLALGQRQEAERRRRLEATAPLLRVGGTLVVVDRFLNGAGGTSSRAPSPRTLLAEIQAAFAGDVVLEHVETLRLPGEDLTSIGLFILTKLGRPRRP